MSKRQKLLARLFNERKPKITYEEAKSLLIYYGFTLNQKTRDGKRKAASGSHREFIYIGHYKEMVYCRLVEPHGRGDNFLHEIGVLQLRRAIETYQTINGSFDDEEGDE
jgi:hypothetical protein